MWAFCLWCNPLEGDASYHLRNVGLYVKIGMTYALSQCVPLEIIHLGVAYGGIGHIWGREKPKRHDARAFCAFDVYAVATVLFLRMVPCIATLIASNNRSLTRPPRLLMTTHTACNTVRIVCCRWSSQVVSLPSVSSHVAR